MRPTHHESVGLWLLLVRLFWWSLGRHWVVRNLDHGQLGESLVKLLFFIIERLELQAVGVGDLSHIAVKIVL